MTASLVDSSKQNAWPLSTFTYFALRRTARCVLDSDCSAKYAVGTLFTWWYQSTAVAEVSCLENLNSSFSNFCFSIWK